MKIKNTNRIALRALALMTAVASSHAATIVVSNNYTSTIADNGANTYSLIAGGTTMTVIAGTAVTGNPASAGLAVTVAGYTIDNSGTIDGATAGATVGANTTLVNSFVGTVRSTAGQGVSITAGTGSIITNNNLIEGGDDAIRTATNTLTVTNASGATIRGITGANSDGIQALDFLTVTNNGTISGAAAGINAGATALVTNAASSTITGATRGVSGSSALTVNNSGTISATTAAGNAVQGTTGATVTNFLGGVISGGADGVQVTTGAIITNSGRITGVAGDGVQLTDGTVTNNAGGIITGADRGIRYAGAGTVTNDGNITGATAIDFAGAASSDVLNQNAGLITGIVNFGAGADTANINGGAIIGNVDGGAAIDTINFNGSSASITGNVLNFETLQRNGSGLVTITGSTDADNVIVNNGSLYLVGNVIPETAADTTITINAGELGGTGNWDANVFLNGGTLTAGVAPLATGTINLANDLTVAAAGSLLVHFDPIAGTNDLVNVGGIATINPAAQILVSPTSQDAPLQSGNTLVLDVAGTRTGQFGAATFLFEPGHDDGGALQATAGDGAFTSSTVSLSVTNGVDPDDTNVTVVHHYDTVAGLSSFGQQFGGFLNTQVSASTTNATLADFLGFLDYSNAATVQCVMDAYAPVGLQESQYVSVLGAREIHRIVEQQSQSERLFPSDNHVWGNFNYNQFDSEGDSIRYTLGAGATLGTAQVGVLVSQSTSDITDATELESISYGVYFSTGESTGWQWNGYAGASKGETTSTIATIFCPEVDSTINFEPEGDGTQFLLSGAYMYDKGSFTWGPTFGLEYASTELDGSIKPGANLSAMEFDSGKLDSLRFLLGVRADFNAGSRIRPYLSAQWAHEFEGESDGYSATFEGASFDVNAPIQLNEDSLILRAGMMAEISESWHGDVGYLGDVAIDSDGTDSHGLNIGLNASF